MHQNAVYDTSMYKSSAKIMMLKVEIEKNAFKTILKDFNTSKLD